ncbi:hypothetical protein TVAG_302990 [Trichomonas vaginalis G3]|uniref:Uncharacterized protein n=1 Tax=Trichomonas vaginalis (strain ATCC PRA-98 / G3) TaxID=412133 RepID=A2FYZ9_TRIV3|nr:hypothetical protein TVAGG3_0220210 [Trichomonas vaginalis G3]EAX89862.1 hypothetical protein TVAG_302990 [Trichomonas vaginalis G3]KAI5551871.1 hypothetical protein TVAGG3_0220210 [Trichomonas vaginalis G3]|eukprot:XP_001302792.1 hypothetical protein [Trichomonas vaginalis G3]
MKSLLEDISKENFAPRFATFEFRLKYELYGVESALDIGKNSMIQAARYDREVAQILATELKQPLENMKTFLSFVNIDHHIPWARECAKQLPVSEWILQEGDLILLDAIAECDDMEIKQKVNEAKQIVENLNSNDEKVTEMVPFKFEKVEFDESKEKISEMVSYLWFNGQKMSKEKESEMIDLLYKTDDDKLLLGCLIYSELNGINLDYKLLANRIHAKSDIQIAISYVYFKNQKSDWENLPDYLKEIVDRVLSEVNVKKSDIYEQIYINNNLLIRKMLLTMLEMDSNLKEKLKNQTVDTFDFTSVKQIKIGLSQIFSKLENDDICINNRNLPTVYNWPSEFLLYGREKKHFTSPHLPEPDKKWIFAAADNNDSLTYYLKFVDPSAKDIQRFDPEWKYLFPCLCFNSTKSEFDEENLTALYYFLPPSFSRAFYRSIFSRCTNMLPQKLFDQLLTVLPQVPPMTIPKNSSFLLKSDNLFNDKISVIDICNSGDYHDVSKLQELANNGDIDALLVLSNIPRTELMQRLDLSDSIIAVSESARSALEYSLKRGVHYSLMYVEMIKTIKILSMAEIVAIVCNKRFLMACDSDSSFIAALAVFRRIEKEAKGTDYEPMFQCYREMSSILFKNEKYQKWFSQTKLEVSDPI